MRILFNITGISRDRRTKAQLESGRQLTQDRLDQALEREWRRRVAANVSRRLDRKVAQFINGGAK